MSSAKIYYLLIISILCSINSFAHEKLREKNKLSSNVVVAKIDTINITAEEFYNSYEFGPAFVKRENNSKLKYLNYMINEKLLALDGYSRSVDKEKNVSSMFKEFQADIATEELFKKDILPKIKINDTEVDTVISKKQLELNIKWLYSNSKEDIFNYKQKIASGASFDSLVNLQIDNDSVFINDRSLKTNFYQLEKKNPLLASIVDTLKENETSLPIHVNDGWYIVKLENVRRNLITTETEMNKRKTESIEAVRKSKMDSLSDEYVKNIMLKNNPVIKRKTFNILRSYLGKYILDRKKYDNWKLQEKLDSTLDDFNKKSYSNLPLIELKNNKHISLEKFLTWFWNRSEYIKLNKSDLRSFSSSLENLIWVMVRDDLLTETAYKRGFNKTEEFKKQSNWWRDKIVSSAVKNEIKKSVLLEDKEIKIDSSKAEKKFNEDFNKKLLHKVLKLKKKFSIKIFENRLKNISVSDENDPKAVEFYFVKRGGLIPRTPYPVIDYDWINWE